MKEAVETDHFECGLDEKLQARALYEHSWRLAAQRPDERSRVRTADFWLNFVILDLGILAVEFGF